MIRGLSAYETGWAQRFHVPIRTNGLRAAGELTAPAAASIQRRERRHLVQHQGTGPVVGATHMVIRTGVT